MRQVDSLDCRMGHFAQDCKDTHIKVETNLMKYKIMKTNLRAPYNRKDRRSFFALQDIQETTTICEEMIRLGNMQSSEEADPADESRDLQASKLSGTNTPNNKINAGMNRRYRNVSSLNIDACNLS